MNVMTHIQTLDFSVRTYHTLFIAGITTVEQLMNMSLSQVRAVKRIGQNQINEIIDKFEELGWEMAGYHYYPVNFSNNRVNRFILPSDLKLD